MEVNSVVLVNKKKRNSDLTVVDMYIISVTSKAINVCDV